MKNQQNHAIKDLQKKYRTLLSPQEYYLLLLFSTFLLSCSIRTNLENGAHGSYM